VLIHCENCTKPLSPSATACPHCHAATAKGRNKFGKTESCRKCGTQLNAGVYRSVSVGSSIPSHVNLSTGVISHTSTASMRHTKCPNCGEPKPLLRVGDTLAGGCVLALLAVPVILLVPAAIGCLFLITFNHDPHGWTWMSWTTGNNISVWLASVVVWLAPEVFCIWAVVRGAERFRAP
jgi:hypothetical protein